MLVGNADVGFFGSGYKANAVHCGNGNYLTRSGTMGVTSSYVGTMSQWLKFTSAATDSRIITIAGSNEFWNLLGSGIYYRVGFNSAGFSSQYFWQSAAAIPADSAWHHIAVSWDLNHAANSKLIQVYLDGSPMTVGTIIDTNAAFQADYSVNSTTSYFEGDNNAQLFGNVAETYFNAAVKIDLSIPSNLQKFRSAGGHPVFLGTDGHIPTGTSPIVYLKGKSATRTTNAGTGGNFTLTGSLTDVTPP